ncbi:MAG: imidazole glycerol phosphate synthase subunit HisH [Flavobacteriaceae bacterium]|jgi:glutamine amidotransferase|nr:imidazole glycerol phosphate synthase subunit HisH [Flavobacteriaceae bacterium]NBX52099.1 imidazole glycerol phosphate synthase subunit HisH [Pseudomonadota bacterium]NCA28230.1 imidazole glycerol phosphate synthase subunit HisH [Pseudomonadota bacterium]
MKIVIIDYGAGNVKSVFNALKKIDNLCDVIISSDLADIKSANYFILPGVGAFGDCMNSLKSVEGLLSELRNQVLNYKKPFLGICVGMQVLASIGLENGEHHGLGLINGRVEKIPAENGLKIPQMGWNSLKIKSVNHPIVLEIAQDEDFYFANSYHFICQNENNVIGYVDYGIKINAIIAKDNIIGAQFHPEKSGKAGLKFLKNFIDWRPR